MIITKYLIFSLKNFFYIFIQLVSGGTLQFWLEQGLKYAEGGINEQNRNSSVEERIVALQLLVELWVLYPIFVQETAKQSNQILDAIKRASREHSEILKIYSLNLLFKLLDTFAQERNAQAAVIYRKITFSIIENHADFTLREFILRNFQVTFTKFPSIPVEILLEPLVK